jgi:hypothetical protein
MRPSFIFILFIFTGKVAFCQKYIISNTTLNILYHGVDNPLSAIASGYSNKSIFLTTDNGRIYKDPCSKDDYISYLINPDSLGEATINLCTRKKNDTIILFTEKFRVRALPDPVPMVANQKNGKISKSILAAQPCIFAFLENTPYCLTGTVTSYTIIIIRNEQVLFLKDIAGNKLTEEVKAELHLTQSGDRVLFVSIKASMVDETPRDLKQMEFIIK